MKYEIEFVGGPKDGLTEFVLSLEDTIKYYSAPGRIAVYYRSGDLDKNLYIFNSYIRTPKIGKH